VPAYPGFPGNEAVKWVSVLPGGLLEVTEEKEFARAKMWID